MAQFCGRITELFGARVYCQFCLTVLRRKGINNRQNINVNNRSRSADAVGRRPQHWNVEGSLIYYLKKPGQPFESVTVTLLVLDCAHEQLNGAHTLVNFL